MPQRSLFRSRPVARALALVVAVVTLSCGLELRGRMDPGSDVGPSLGTDAGGGAGDASVDRNEPADAGFMPDRASTTDARADATDADPGDGGLVFTCRDAATNDCASCTGLTLPCVYCSTTSSSLKGVCSSPNVNCFSNEPAGFKVCSCNYPSASACPMPWQTCHQFSGYEDCYTCGESYSNGDSCKGGGSCDEQARKCQ